MVKSFVNGRGLAGETVFLTVDGGRFVAFDPAAPTTDLMGATVLPGFVDAHCHIIPMGLDMDKLHLGHCRTREEVLGAVRDWNSDRPDGWLLAVHYDQTKFADSQHLTRNELDSVVPGRPVLLRHSNGHASVANSRALELAGISESVQDPAGGTFVRDSSGRLNGVLLERAHERVTSASPEPTLEDMTRAVLRAGERMSQLGVTCASDMMTGRWNLERELLAYNAAAQQGCPVRLRLYAQWGTVLGPRRLRPERLAEITQDMDPERCRLAGIKIFADGAIGSATAAIYGAFLTTGGDGQLIYGPERFKDMVRTADEAGWQLAVHSIGDRSTDVVMDAYAMTVDPSRHRIEHAMILSDAQIERLRGLGSFTTMQPEFLLRFGHSYRKQLGAERAATLKRFRSLLDAGIPLSFSSDRPIVPGDPWDGIRVATERPEGFDPSENIPLTDAFALYTVASAAANGDAGQMGELLPGRFADFQVYSSEAGAAPPDQVWMAGEAVTGPSSAATAERQSTA